MRAPVTERSIWSPSVGTWRSLVAHLHGVQGVGGSNPLVPTNLTLFESNGHDSGQANVYERPLVAFRKINAACCLAKYLTG